MTKTGLFVGSFDPFTLGHASIVDRGLALFDKLFVGVGINSQKTYTQPAEARVEAIARIYAKDQRVSVIAYDDLTVDLARRVGADFLVKGIRDEEDFKYEMMQADYNRAHGDIETIWLPAEPQFKEISSTIVRNLQSGGGDIDQFLPTQRIKV